MRSYAILFSGSVLLWLKFPISYLLLSVLEHLGNQLKYSRLHQEGTAILRILHTSMIQLPDKALLMLQSIWDLVSGVQKIVQISYVSQDSR